MTNTELIYDAWYVAAHAKALARGKTKKVQMLGAKLLLGRSDVHGHATDALNSRDVLGRAHQRADRLA